MGRILNDINTKEKFYKKGALDKKKVIKLIKFRLENRI